MTEKNKSITLLDGRHVSQRLQQDIKEEVESFKVKPRLGFIQVGDNPASQTYVKSKLRKCKECNIETTSIILPDDITEDELLSHIDDFNKNDSINGFIVQLPLPEHISTDKIINSIDSTKDIDGFSIENIGKMVLNMDTFLPATPFGILELLDYYNIDTKGKNCVVIGRSNIVGLPISIMLGHNDMATVTSCHINTENISKITRNADILICAVGKENMITEEMVKEDVVIIDVGINRIPDTDSPKGYRIVGDVDFDNVSKKASYITPVPGGVGPMTIISLLRNIIKAYKNQNNIKY